MASIADKGDQGNLKVTYHAVTRMHGRRINMDAVKEVMQFGRHAHVRGAIIYAIGKKEIGLYKAKGVKLDSYEGIQVVCSPDGSILTVYRNRDFKGLRV